MQKKKKKLQNVQQMNSGFYVPLLMVSVVDFFCKVVRVL